MGGTSSTRNITLVNNESSGVIKISDSVVKRLRGEAEQASSKKAEPERSSLSIPSRDVRHRHDSGAPKRPLSSYEDMRSQALHLNQEHEEQLRKLETHWKEKLTAAEEQNVIVQKRMANEFTAAVDNVEKLFPSHSCTSVCADQQQKVQQCYESNSKTSLQCSKVVKEFSECVQQARLGALIRG